ncbi:hypothetical protein FKP32DRAFT_1241583 [Trametes sanguinea]|nr:hypothetical protein FKP32DRAFT_1241583 [Trametes sanguinea]
MEKWYEGYLVLGHTHGRSSHTRMVRKKRVSTQQSASARLASVKTEVREQVTVKFEPLEDGQILESLSRHPEEWENAEASDIAAVDEIVSLRNTRQRKRSHSRRPESSLGLGGGLDNGNGVDSNERIKRTKRDRSPELTITIVDEVPEPIVPIERPAVVKAPLMQQVESSKPSQVNVSPHLYMIGELCRSHIICL